MTRRRTRKEKLSAKHSYLINWDSLMTGNSDNSRLSEANVNRQKESSASSKATSKGTIKNAVHMEKGYITGSVKTDLIKSLIVSIAIISLELVLYLNWK
jgi:hypothetical protein